MDLDQAIGEAYDAALNEASPAPASPQAATPAAAPAAPEAPVETAPVAPEAPKNEKARDDAGRFAKAPEPAAKGAGDGKAEKPKPEAKVEPPAPGEKPPEVAADPAKTAPKIRAPQAWGPAMRERFGELPDWAQQEIDRRERNVSTAMTKALDNKRWREEIEGAIRPYEPMLRAMGAEPLPAIQSLLQFAATLQSPRAPEAVATLIKRNRIDLEAINDALGLGGAEGKPRPPADPRLDQALQQIAALQQQIATAATSSAQREQERAADAVEAFGKDRPFFSDVREKMGLLIQSGLAPDLETAYDQAVAMNPEIRAIIEQRKAAEVAKANIASTQAAIQASSSIKTHPGAPPVPARRASVEDTLTALLEAE